MESVKKRLQTDAALVRKIYLDKPVRKSNVAILELHLINQYLCQNKSLQKFWQNSQNPPHIDV